jgi:phenylalanine-4-hydroxylase
MAQWLVAASSPWADHVDIAVTCCYLVLKHGLLEHLPFSSMIFSSGSPDTEGYLQYPKEVHEGLGHCLWLSLPDPHGDLHALQLGLRAIQQL